MISSPPMSHGDSGTNIYETGYSNKQGISSITSLFKMGTSSELLPLRTVPMGVKEHFFHIF